MVQCIATDRFENVYKVLLPVIHMPRSINVYNINRQLVSRTIINYEQQQHNCICIQPVHHWGRLVDEPQSGRALFYKTWLGGGKLAGKHVNNAHTL